MKATVGQREPSVVLQSVDYLTHCAAGARRKLFSETAATFPKISPSK
jgi:hypothetical protein